MDRWHHSNLNELDDLVQRGVLTYRQRRPDYVERRTDGYVEPEHIFIVGTSHHSTSSAEDVRRVIEAVRPESVVVELCRSRKGMLFGQNREMGLSGENKKDFGGVLTRSLRLGGPDALLAQFLLAKSSGGLSTGLDFVAARDAADVVGAQLVLGDRPIEITMKRALNELSLRDKLTLGNALFLRLFRKRQRPAVLTESVPSTTDIDTFLRALSERFPRLYSPLVTERDLYLTWSLKRSKAVNGTSRVVGVVGAAHVPGILRAIDDDAGNNSSPLRFKDLVRLPDKGPLAVRVARRLTLDTALFLAAYGVYHLFVLLSSSN